MLYTVCYKSDMFFLQCYYQFQRLLIYYLALFKMMIAIRLIIVAVVVTVRLVTVLDESFMNPDFSTDLATSGRIARR